MNPRRFFFKRAVGLLSLLGASSAVLSSMASNSIKVTSGKKASKLQVKNFLYEIGFFDNLFSVINVDEILAQKMTNTDQGVLSGKSVDQIKNEIVERAIAVYQGNLSESDIAELRLNYSSRAGRNYIQAETEFIKAMSLTNIKQSSNT